jgi:serine/threonine-protein kinase
MDATERLTRTGFFVGTLKYVAPEALSGELVDEAADIYSLATIAYYLLTCQHPYPGRSPRELFQQLLTQDPVPLNEADKTRQFSASLQAAIMAALVRDPKSRPESVEAFASSLNEALTAPDAEPAAAAPASEGLLGKMKSMFRSKRD